LHLVVLRTKLFVLEIQWKKELTHGLKKQQDHNSLKKLNQDLTTKLDQCMNFTFFLKTSELSKEAQYEATRRVIALIPYQITQFKGEYSRFKQKISNPGSLLVGDFQGWIRLVILGIFAFYIGMSIGRWHMFGFRYENENLE
jgi:hypothetical protein